jgi:hypothetical protein
MGPLEVAPFQSVLLVYPLIFANASLTRSLWPLIATPASAREAFFAKDRLEAQDVPMNAAFSPSSLFSV